MVPRTTIDVSGVRQARYAGKGLDVQPLAVANLADELGRRDLGEIAVDTAVEEWPSWAVIARRGFPSWARAVASECRSAWEWTLRSRPTPLLSRRLLLRCSARWHSEDIFRWMSTCLSIGNVLLYTKPPFDIHSAEQGGRAWT